MRSSPRLPEVLDAMFDGIVLISLDGRITYWNRAAESLLGWQSDEVLERSLVDTLVAPEDTVRVAAALEAARVGAPWSGTAALCRRRRPPFAARFTLSPVAGEEDGVEGILGVIRPADVREPAEAPPASVKDPLVEQLRLAREQAESEREHLYRLLMEAPAAICVHRGPDYVFEMANRRYLEMARRQQVVGLPVRDVFPELERQRYFDLLTKAYATGETITGDELSAVFLPEDGHPLQIYLNVIFQPITTDGQISGVFVLGVDVTEQVRAQRRTDSLLGELRSLNHTLEERVADRTQELRAANAMLVQRNRELQDLAYIASHDLREPLRKIQTFASLVLEDYSEQLDEPGRLYLARLRDAGNRMMNLIHDLLVYSRVASRGEPFRRVDLTRLVQEVVGDYAEVIRDVGGRVEIGELPPVQADPSQLRQLLAHLVDNGLKFRRPDVAPHIQIRASVVARQGGVLEEDWVTIEVEDNGIGFEPRFCERIFSPFQRLHGRGGIYEGTGMGLAICRRVVERHGGTIRAEGRPGEGSLFTIELPMTPPPFTA